MLKTGSTVTRFVSSAAKIRPHSLTQVLISSPNRHAHNNWNKPDALWDPTGKGQTSGSYYGSPIEGPRKQYTDVEKSFPEWKWVERLIPPQTVPPLLEATPGKIFPSGFTVPKPPKNCSYYIPRNKNHMVPVYTLIWDRGQLRETRIRHVEGNIWALEKDVGKHLKKLYPKKMILTYTQECARFVGIKGDYTEEVKEWIIYKGF